MATFAIGDIQGCLDPLLRLLEQLRFEPGQDRLIFAGDLVNRGPQSAETLRFVKSLGPAAITVLGNHDLHLLARAHGGKSGSRDTLDDLLKAPDCDELLDWLSRQPLAYEEPASGVLVVHAGLPPQWDRKQALQLSEEASKVISGSEAATFYRRMYGDEPDQWSEDLLGWPRLRFIVNCFTRLRYCTAAGRIDMKEKHGPGMQRRELLPWFEVPGRKTAGDTIVFGHWSTLGRVAWCDGKVYGLDTGCVWGGGLTAMNLETREVTSVNCSQYKRPGADVD